jgi:hypothetical protein
MHRFGIAIPRKKAMDSGGRQQAHERESGLPANGKKSMIETVSNVGIP